jgi:hypothetical protein
MWINGYRAYIAKNYSEKYANQNHFYGLQHA